MSRPKRKRYPKAEAVNSQNSRVGDTEADPLNVAQRRWERKITAEESVRGRERSTVTAETGLDRLTPWMASGRQERRVTQEYLHQSMDPGILGSRVSSR